MWTDGRLHTVRTQCTCSDFSVRLLVRERAYGGYCHIRSAMKIVRAAGNNGRDYNYYFVFFRPVFVQIDILRMDFGSKFVPFSGSIK